MPSDSQTPHALKTRSVARYAVPLVLLIAIIGGIAWVVQYLPRWQTPAKATSAPRDKEMVRFALGVTDVGGQAYVRAFWSKTDPNAVREFEPGAKGHYDFLFKNTLEHDIEVVHYASSCDCASMDACALPLAEVERLGQILNDKPGDPLRYQVEPNWVELPKDPLKPIHLKIKANEGGAVRVRWSAKKNAGAELRVRPEVFIQADGDPSSKKGFTLFVPAIMTHPVRIYPPREKVGPLLSGSVVKAEFDAWSPTRDDFDLDLTLPEPDPLFVVTTKKLTKPECAELQQTLSAIKIPTHVKSGYHVTITVHENRAGQQLDLGSFLRKFALKVDGNNLMHEVPGVEVVGRVLQPDLTVGVADDQGKIRFKSFDVATGASKTIELHAAANAQLELVKHHSHQPTWLQTRLTSDKNVIDGKKRVWHLEVTVPPNTPVARSFDEPDAVVLAIQIKGELVRYVRIPLEGHASGR